jgi:hypothetical protein
MTKFVLFALLSLATVFSTVCLGQFETATVLGTVRDPSGAAMVGSKVTLENVKTGVSAVSTANDAGNFEFINVAIGTYRVKAESSGFKTSETEDFTVTVSPTAANVRSSSATRSTSATAFAATIARCTAGVWSADSTLPLFRTTTGR